ncbi:hypothetical protein [Thomasclavelia spiroformis]|jgi:hypothetical protein|nr:hypothetical protein [Thomasclavelia spiroformis]
MEKIKELFAIVLVIVALFTCGNELLQNCYVYVLNCNIIETST